MRILIADHDPTMLEQTARALRDLLPVDIVTSKANCLDLLRQNDFHLLVACERLDDGSGLELLSQVSRRWPDVLRVLAVDPQRMPLLAGRLGPFRLFQSLPYPIDPAKLRSILTIAMAAEAANADTANVQHIVLADEAEEEQQPARAVQATAARAPGSMRFDPRARAEPAARQTAVRSAAMPRPAVAPRTAGPRADNLSPGERRIADRRSGAERRVPSEQATEFPALGLAEAAEIAASLRSSLAQTPAAFKPKRLALLVVAAAVVAVAAVIGFKMRGAPAPAVQIPPPSVSTPRPGSSPEVTALIREVEAALTADDFTRARASTERLRAMAPENPRLAFLDALVRRGEEAERLAMSAASVESTPQQAAKVTAAERTASTPPRTKSSPRAELPADAPDKAASIPVSSAAASPSGTAPTAAAVTGAAVAAATPAQPSAVAKLQPASVSAGKTLEESAFANPTAVNATPPSEPSEAAVRARTVTLPVVTEARLLKRVSPEYPTRAARAGVEGSIELSFTITADGNVTGVEVVRGTPPNMFDSAAIAAVRRWKYEPRREDGTAVDSRTRVRLEFKLAN